MDGENSAFDIFHVKCYRKLKTHKTKPFSPALIQPIEILCISHFAGTNIIWKVAGKHNFEIQNKSPKFYIIFVLFFDLGNTSLSVMFGGFLETKKRKLGGPLTQTSL